MKAFGCMLIVCLLILGCEFKVSHEDMIKSECAYRASGHDLYYNPNFDDLSSLDDILVYLCKEEYRYKHDQYDSWNNPEKTYHDKAGDCEDYAILVLNILYMNTREKLGIALVNYDKSNPWPNHVALYRDHTIYSQYTMKPDTDANLIFVFSFDEVFN
jgi:hypothetical protein